MADAREPRPSTDEETAPLLHDAPPPEPAQPTLLERITSATQEPLTPLTKLLLVVALIFLLLSSVFIGLFAGAQHKLSHGGEDSPASTVTVTATATTTATATSTFTHTSTVAIPGPSPTSPPEQPVCLSADCIMLASSVLSSLDLSYDPCENFYDFAAGGWLKTHPVPADKGGFGQFEALSIENKRVLEQILSSTTVLDEPSESPYDGQVLKKLRGLYSSCMDEEKLNEIGAEPLAKITSKIREILKGRTTIVDSVDDDSRKLHRESFTAALAYVHSRGIGGLFEASIEGDVGTDPNFMTLWVGQTDLGLPSKEYYDEEDIVELYTGVLERLLITLAEEERKLEVDLQSVLKVYEERLRVWPPWPWPPWGGDGGDDDDDDDDKHRPRPPTDRKEARRLAERVVKLEKAIANISLDLDIIQQDPFATYNPAPLESLIADLPQVDFPAYFATFAPRNFPANLIIMSTSYPKLLSDILDTVDADTIEAYFVTRTGLEYAQFLGVETEAWRAVRSLEERLRGLKKGAVGDRSEYCISQVEETMGFAAGRYFVNQTFGGDSREKGTKIIEDIVEVFKQSLFKLDWMDQKSAIAAAEKADAIRVKVGFPLSPDTRNARSIANYYSLVTIHEDAFFENILNANIDEERRMWQKLGKQRDPEEWEMYPSMVNAYFNPPANEIVFPAGIMQPPFFSKEWPGYMSYGSFGQVAAHELTHAFDSAGRMYNQQGKLEPWWTNATSEGFNVRQKCIVNQYSKYTIDDGKGGKIHVNGNLTSGENIGDTGTIQAYRAWKAQYYDATEFLLPGLNFTHEQMFFIATAQHWARNLKPESAVARVRTDPHSPNRYRVDGVVYNIPEFAQAFNCSPKAKLNPPPEERCLFWS